MFVGSCFIILKKSGGLLKSFPTDFPPKITGRGGEGDQCQKFVTSLACLLHPAELEQVKLKRVLLQ